MEQISKDRLEELKKGLMAMLFIALSKLTDKQARENVKDTAANTLLVIDEKIAQLDLVETEVDKLTKKINEMAKAEIARQSNPGSQSDGYHTFDELYDQRAVLFAALCRAYPDKAWRSKLHHDGTMFDGGYFIVGIETIKGQYTYHYKLNRWDLYDCCKTLDRAPEWDGHTDKDVERLLFLPDGESQQNVTDEAVTAAIESFSRAVYATENYEGFHRLPSGQLADLKRNKLAIAALLAYRRPTAKEVAEIDRAITILTKGREQFSYRAINAFDGALDLAITALRRMKGSDNQ